MIHLNESDKETIINLLKIGLKSSGEIWVFGSRIRPHGVKKFSDLDLTFVGTSPLDVQQLEQLKELFSASDLSFRVDVCNLDDLPKSLKEDVINNHELLYRA